MVPKNAKNATHSRSEKAGMILVSPASKPRSAAERILLPTASELCSVSDIVVEKSINPG